LTRARPHGSARAFALLACAAALACGGDATPPETAVRSALAAIEDAARARDVAALRGRISEAYADPQGYDKRTVSRIAAFHLLGHQSVYTLTRVQSLELPEAGRAEVEALVAMAGTAIPDADALALVSADLYRFRVTLREEEPETWRVVSATWQPATIGDFR
jgi:hypothetical protein